MDWSAFFWTSLLNTQGWHTLRALRTQTAETIHIHTNLSGLFTCSPQKLFIVTPLLISSKQWILVGGESPMFELYCRWAILKQPLGHKTVYQKVVMKTVGCPFFMEHPVVSWPLYTVCLFWRAVERSCAKENKLSCTDNRISLQRRESCLLVSHCLFHPLVLLSTKI